MNVTINYPHPMPQSIILPVCGGSAEMNGRPFLAYVREAGKHFKNVHVVLADSLDAWNLAGDPALLAQAREVACAMGDRWLKKHFGDIESAFEGRVTLARWDAVRRDPSFAEKYDLTVRLYETSLPVRQWMESVCGEYVEIAARRAAEKGLLLDRAKKMDQSIRYMLEETAGSSVYYDWYRAPALYPGLYFPSSDFFSRHNAIAPTVDLCVPPHIAVWSEGLRQAA